MRTSPTSLPRLIPAAVLAAFLGCMGGTHWPPAVSTKDQIEKLPVTQRDIRAIQIADPELQLIAERFPQLDYLFVSPYASISDKGVSHLSKLPLLRQIVVDDGSRLTDRSIQVLTGLPKLRELMITGATQLTDTSLDMLAKKKELKLLYLSNSPKFSDRSKAELKNSLPNCKITLG